MLKKLKNTRLLLGVGIAQVSGIRFPVSDILRIYYKTSGDLMLNKGDFIKLEYTGYDDKGNVFDSTAGEIAKKLHNQEGALLIIFGYDKLVSGLEEAVSHMKKGESRELMLTSERAFGERKKEMIKVVPEVELLKNNVQPEVGVTLQLDTDQGPLFGVIKSVNSGRVTMDFNHPLAGKNVKYSIKLVDVIMDKEIKIPILLDDMQLKGKARFSADKLELDIEKSKDRNDEEAKEYEVKKQYLAELVKVLIPEIKSVEIKEI